MKFSRKKEQLDPESGTIRIKLNLNADKPLTEEIAVDQVNKAIKKLVEYGAFKGDPEDFMESYDIVLGSSNYVLIDIKKSAYIDGAPLASVGAERISSQEIPSDAKVFIEANKSFSQASIKERLRMSKMDPKMKFRYVVIDYRRYYSAQKDKLLENLDEFKKLRNMFIHDLMNMISDVAPLIQEGKQLGFLLGTQQYSPKIGKVAREFSLAYRKTLTSIEKDGTPRPMLYKVLDMKFREFINEMLPSIFPGIEDIDFNKPGGGATVNISSAKSPNEEEFNRGLRQSSQMTTAVEGQQQYSFSRSRDYTTDNRINLFK